MHLQDVPTQVEVHEDPATGEHECVLLEKVKHSFEQSNPPLVYEQLELQKVAGFRMEELQVD